MLIEGRAATHAARPSCLSDSAEPVRAGNPSCVHSFDRGTDTAKLAEPMCELDRENEPQRPEFADCAPDPPPVASSAGPRLSSSRTATPRRIFTPSGRDGRPGMPETRGIPVTSFREEAMRSRMAALALGLATLASVAPAQDTTKLPPTVIADTLNVLTVQNQRNVPVTVYMEYGRFDRRLGEVQPFDVARLPLPEWAVRSRTRIQLFVHPEGEGGRDLATHHFSLRAPARLALRVPPRGGSEPPPTDTMTEVIPPEQLAEATLTVDNARDKTVTVYAKQGPFDVRLGQVPAGGRETLRFPKSIVHPGEFIQIFVHPDGEMDLASERLKIERGKHLGLRVPRR